MATIDPMQVARILEEVAAAEIMPRWRNLAKDDVVAKTGENTGLVTVADHAAEAALTRRLTALLPASIVVGEEAVAADPDVLGRFESLGPVWVVDPIDGTRRFAEGATAFDVMVALVVGGVPVAGWIYAPAEGTLYVGEVNETGGRAELHEHGEVSAITPGASLPLEALEGILGTGAFTSRGLRDPKHARDRFAGFVKHQCAGHNYGRLFRRECHFLINFSTHPWDHLPGLAIAAAAGFHAARHDSRPFDPRDRHGGILVAQSRESWEAVHEVLFAPATDSGGADKG